MAEFIVDYERNRRAEALGLETMPESWSTGFGAALEETLARNPTRALINEAERNKYYDRVYTDEFGQEHEIPAVPSRMLTKEEANEKYGIAGKLEFDADTPEPVAEQLNRLNVEELLRQDIRKRSTAGIGADLTAGLIGSLADPLNVASAFIPVVGEARYASLVARLGTPGARVATGAVEGAVGAAVVEPLVYLGAQWESADYTAADSVMNLVFGTVLGGGLHLGAGYIGDRWAGRQNASPLQDFMDRAPMEDRAAIISTAGKQIMEGQPIDIEPVVAATAAEMQRRGFLQPHELRMLQHEEKAARFGLTEEQAKAFMPEDIRDPVTGFYKAEDRVPTVRRAMEYSRETGQPAVYVEADIANLGGLNARFGHTGADEVYAEMAQLFAEAIQSAGGVGVLVRHGGDEISAIVTGIPDAAVEGALNAMQGRIAAMVERRGIGDLPHAKDPTSPPGTRINYGVSQIDPDLTISEIISRADLQVELHKKKGAPDVKRSEIGEAGVVALDESAPGTGGGFGGSTLRTGGEFGPTPSNAPAILEPRALESWIEAQNRAQIDPETKAGMRAAESTIQGEMGPPKELDAIIRETEEDILDIESGLTEEDIARYESAPEEGIPTVKEIADMESTEPVYNRAVSEAANCLTGRR